MTLWHAQTIHSSPPRHKNDSARNIDQFYEEASLKDTKPTAAHYWFILLAMGIAHSGDSTEILSLNYVLADNGFANDILHDNFKERGAFLASCVFGGMLVGGLMTGAFGDQVGRRPILLLGLTLNSIAGLGAALAPNLSIMSAFRFVSGMGVGAIISSVMALATETSPPSRRGRNVGFVASFFTLGTIYVSLVAIIFLGRYNLSWRVFLALNALPVVCGNIMIWLLVPESSRFLALKNKPVEACESANTIAHAMGYRGPKLEVEEVTFHYSCIANKETDVNVWIALQRAMNNVLKLYSPNLRCTTITLQLIWISQSFGSGLNTWINVVLKELRVANIFMDALYFSMATIPGNIIAAALLDRVGRKTMMVIGLFFCSLSLFFFARAAEYVGPDSSSSAVISACFFHGFLQISWVAINLNTSELFPTEVRNTGLGVCSATGKLAAMLAQFVNGALIAKPGTLLSVTSLVLLCGGLCLFFLRDTSNEHLADTISDSSFNKQDNSGNASSESHQPLINSRSKMICQKIGSQSDDDSTSPGMPMMELV